MTENTNPAAMPEECRTEFEKWYSQNDPHCPSIQRSGEGYKLMQGQQAWTAWQASWNIRADRATQPGELSEALRTLDWQNDLNIIEVGLRNFMHMDKSDADINCMRIARIRQLLLGLTANRLKQGDTKGEK